MRPVHVSVVDALRERVDRLEVENARQREVISDLVDALYKHSRPGLNDVMRAAGDHLATLAATIAVGSPRGDWSTLDVAVCAWEDTVKPLGPAAP